MECYNFTATYKKVPAADADIAGIGVLLSFLISAWSAFALTAFSYIWGFIPESLLSDFDVRFLRARQKASKEWTKTFQKAVLIFSDQQIVTGIAILIAGFGQFDKISVYHWQIVVYQAWMSSNVHLTSLTMLRCFLNSTVLGSSEFIYPPDRSYPIDNAWRFGYFKTINVDAIFSYIFICGAYIWKIAALFEPSHILFLRWTVKLPMQFMQRRLCRLAKRQGSESRSTATVYKYRVLMVFYAGVLAWTDLGKSFIGSLLLVFGFLIYGTSAVLSPRQSLPGSVHIDESSWGFGQVLPMLLLVLPLLALGEHFMDSKTETSGVLEAEQESLTRRSTDGSPNPMHSRDLAQVPDILEDEEATALKAQQEPLVRSISPASQPIQSCISSQVAELDFQDEKTLEKTLEDLHLMLYKTRTMRWLRGSTLIATTAIISTVVGILIQTRGRNITSAIGYYVAPPLGLVLLVSMGSLVLDRELYR